jgi:hypothetical protein
MPPLAKPTATTVPNPLPVDDQDPAVEPLVRHARGEDEVILGLEQELSASGVSSDGSPIEGPSASRLLLKQLKEDLPWLPDTQAEHCSAYFPWGGRDYIDCGHLETTSGEAPTPEHLVAQIFAMDKAVTDAIQNLEAADGTRLRVTKSTICYRNGTTFGNHLNLFVKSSGDFVNRTEAVYPALLPFFASRIILGPGGFPNVAEDPFGFLLDPRACHIRADIGNDSTSSRTIIHTRGNSEPLCRGGSRLHDIALSAPLSPMASYLRFATSALVVGLLDQGLRPRRLPAFTLPANEAMRQWNTDAKLQRKVASTIGLIDIVDMQQLYLDFVADNLSAAPAFAETALGHWSSLLDRLRAYRDSPAESLPETSLVNHLDWARKLLIYDRLLNRSSSEGNGDESPWTYEKISRTLLTTPPQLLGEPDAAERRTQSSSMRRRMIEMGVLRDSTASENESWANESDDSESAATPSISADQEKAIQLRNQLHSLDTQFSDLANPGFGMIQWQLPELGIGAEQIDAVLDGRAAAACPNRCRIRSHYITTWGAGRFSRRQRGADWRSISDRGQNRTLQIEKPFEHRLPTSARDSLWQKTPDVPRSRLRRAPTPAADAGGPYSVPATVEAQHSTSEALDLYDKGRLVEADQVMTRIPEQIGDRRISDASHDNIRRYWSWIHIRRGYLEKAQRLIHQNYGADRRDEDVSNYQELLAWLTIYRHAGLSNAPDRPEFARWIGVGERMMANSHRPRIDHDGAAFQTALGLWQAFHVDRQRGLLTVTEALNSSGFDSLQPFPHQRAIQTVARVQMLNARFDEARIQLDRAEGICQRREYRGELGLIEFLRAQCCYAEGRDPLNPAALNHDAIRTHLASGRAIVSSQRHWNPVTLARIDAALARISGPDDSDNDERRHRLHGLIHSYDGLRDPLGELIIREWDAWVGGDAPPPTDTDGEGVSSSTPTDSVWWSL